MLQNKRPCVFFSAKIRGQRSRFEPLQVNNTGAAVDRSFIAGGGIEVHFTYWSCQVLPVTNASNWRGEVQQSFAGNLVCSELWQLVCWRTLFEGQMLGKSRLHPWHWTIRQRPNASKSNPRIRRHRKTYSLWDSPMFFYSLPILSSWFSSIPWVSKNLKSQNICRSFSSHSSGCQTQFCQSSKESLLEIAVLAHFRDLFSFSFSAQISRLQNDSSQVEGLRFQTLFLVCQSLSIFVDLCGAVESQGILRAQELQRLQWIDDATDALQVETLKPASKTRQRCKTCRVVVFFQCLFLSVTFYSYLATAQSTSCTKP